MRTTVPALQDRLRTEADALGVLGGASLAERPDGKFPALDPNVNDKRIIQFHRGVAETVAPRPTTTAGKAVPPVTIASRRIAPVLFVGDLVAPRGGVRGLVVLLDPQELLQSLLARQG